MNAPTPTVVETEMAYDLLQDHTELVLELLEKPMTREDVVDKLGKEKTLERLLKHGLVTADGNTIHAVAEAYLQARQEGMISFLERYILPALNAGLATRTGSESTGLAQVWAHDLKLPAEMMASIRGDFMNDFFDNLLQASDLPAKGPLSRLSVLIIGTSRPLSGPLKSEDAILEQLKLASLQRADEHERDFAILSQFDCLADTGRFEAAREVVDSLSKSVEERQAPTLEEANYHLTVAVHWRCTAASGMETGVEASQLLC
ncbi:MAG: hypothetical protein VX834_03040 [Myxococcota bacterium]|nr:hypothetical protein [Myxococcota bacterium]